MTIIEILIIGIVLSIDAFSIAIPLSLIEKGNIKYFPIIVGIFHFIFPIFGNFFGILVKSIISINSSYLMIGIYIYLILDIIFQKDNNEKNNDKLNFIKIILISFSVSIDSFTIGIGLNLIISKLIIVSMIFSIMAYSFTKLGLLIGYKLKDKINSCVKIISLVLLFSLLIRHIIG